MCQPIQVLEDLFTKCKDAITEIYMMVNGIRDLPMELQSLVVETLVAILEVFRIATQYAK